MTARALLVGIDRYADPRIPPLLGCKADVADMRGLLVGTYGFDPADILTLEDAEATRFGILCGLDWLFGGSEDGYPRVFYFAGHGSVAPDIDNDEGPGDRYDEILCPHDWKPDNPGPTGILDDDIHRLLAALLKTAVVALVFDCCYGGGLLSRGVVPGPGARRFAPPAGLPPHHPGELIPGRPHPVSLKGLKADVVAWSSCGAMQVAQEVRDASGNHRGAGTMALTSSHRRRPFVACWEAKGAMDRTLVDFGLCQSPQLEGSRNRRRGGIFGIRARTAEPAILAPGA